MYVVCLIEADWGSMAVQWPKCFWVEYTTLVYCFYKQMFLQLPLPFLCHKVNTIKRILSWNWIVQSPLPEDFPVLQSKFTFDC